MVATSVSASHSGLPVSRPMVCASCALCSPSRRANSRMMASRFSNARSAHAVNALRAAEAAAATSCADAARPRHTRSLLTGLREKNSAPRPSCQRPLIQWVFICDASFMGIVVRRWRVNAKVASGVLQNQATPRMARSLGESGTARIASPSLTPSAAHCSALSAKDSPCGVPLTSSTRNPARLVFDSR